MKKKVLKFVGAFMCSLSVFSSTLVYGAPEWTTAADIELLSMCVHDMNFSDYEAGQLSTTLGASFTIDECKQRIKEFQTYISSYIFDKNWSTTVWPDLSNYVNNNLLIWHNNRDTNSYVPQTFDENVIVRTFEGAHKQIFKDIPVIVLMHMYCCSGHHPLSADQFLDSRYYNDLHTYYKGIIDFARRTNIYCIPSITVDNF